MDSLYYQGRLRSRVTLGQLLILFLLQQELLQFCDSSLLAKLGKKKICKKILHYCYGHNNNLYYQLETNHFLQKVQC